MNELRKIAEEIDAMDGGDKEGDHSRADDLLIEAIKYLASVADQTVDRVNALRVIQAWEKKSSGWWWA